MCVSSTDSDDEEANLPLSSIRVCMKRKQLNSSSIVDITNIAKNTNNQRIRKINPLTLKKRTDGKIHKIENTKTINEDANKISDNNISNKNNSENIEDVSVISNKAIRALHSVSDSDSDKLEISLDNSIRKKLRERREKFLKKTSSNQNFNRSSSDNNNINNNNNNNNNNDNINTKRKAIESKIVSRKFFKSAEHTHARKVVTSTATTNTGTDDQEGIKELVIPNIYLYIKEESPGLSISRKRKINRLTTSNKFQRVLKPISGTKDIQQIVPKLVENSTTAIINNNNVLYPVESFSSFVRHIKPDLNRQKLSLPGFKQQQQQQEATLIKKRKYPSTSTPFVTHHFDSLTNNNEGKENFTQSTPSGSSIGKIISKKHKVNNISKEFADISSVEFPKTTDKDFLVEEKISKNSSIEDSAPKPNKINKLSLSSVGSLKNNTTSKNSESYNNNKQKEGELFEINNNNNNNNKNSLEVIVEEENLINSGQKNKTEMSLYDYRVQSDDRPVGNCFVARGSHSNSGNNDENSGTLVNQYYQYSQPSIATLCNIGNTCYLNSVVYTLRFAPLFLHNLHHLVEDLSNVHNRIVKNRAKSSSLGRNVSGLHMENPRSWSSKDLASLENSSSDVPKSNQQIATEKLHELYQNLHRNELLDSTEPFHADTFLHAIQEVSAIFEGNQQQDAHEFLMCVLDSIRETCQALIKAIIDCPEVINNVCLSLPEHAEAAAIKDQPPPRESSTSSAALIKTKFFSRKSKRKDDTKNSKNVRIHSPHKDNTTIISPDMVDGTTNSKNSLSSSSTTDDDVSVNDKEKLSEKIKKLGLDFFSEDFEGITVSTTKCLSCETITEQKETMIDIAVPASGYKNSGGNNSSNKVDEFFIQNSCITREYFCGDNKYRCEQCIGYTEAIRSISYEVLPRLLIIQLNRFSGGMEKINTYLPTPFILECFCAKCCELKKNKLHVYKLYSVITHVGATMSVGHYIAYTCSLDWASEYINCPKDRRRQAANLNSCTTSSSNNSTGISGSSNSSGNNTTATTTTQEKNVGIVKKMIFGRSKASSSGDVTKNVKNINGISSKTSLTNGIDKLSINTTCPSVNCCGIKLKTNHHHVTSNNHTTTNPYSNTNGICPDISENQSSGYESANFTNSSSLSASNKTNKVTPSGKQTWYMCDDDKIKAMSQSEFEDLLSPERKIMITPYLLFYARSDLQ